MADILKAKITIKLDEEVKKAIKRAQKYRRAYRWKHSNRKRRYW